MSRRGLQRVHLAEPTVTTVGPRRIGIRLATYEHRETRRTVRLDPSLHHCTELFADLADVWVGLCERGLTYNQAVRVAVAIRSLGRWCDAQEHGPRKLAQLDAVALASFESALAVEHPLPSNRAGEIASSLFELLRHAGETRRIELDASVRQRIESPPANVQRRRSAPLADYTDDQVVRIARHALSDALAVERRLATGRSLLAVPPENMAPGSLGHLVHLASRQALSVETLIESGMQNGLPAETRRALEPLIPCAGAKYFVPAVHRYLYPSLRDLLPYALLLILELGAPPECITDLGIDDVLLGTNSAEVLLTKQRGGRSYRRRIRDRGWPSGGAVLRSLLRATEPARNMVGTSALFVHADIGNHTGGQLRLYRVTSWRNAYRRFIQDHHLTEPETTHRRNGDRDWPALGPPHDLRRLRKATVARLAVAEPDRYPVMADHTVEVFHGHYTNSTVLRAQAGRTITELQADLMNRARSYEGPTIITPDAEAQLMAGPGPHDALINGELDMGLASCRDPYASPFGVAGLLCPVSTTGDCWQCPNAVITSRHLPAIVAWLDEVLEYQRRVLAPDRFAQRWAPLRRWLTEYVLPLFGEQRVAAARRKLPPLELVAERGMRPTAG